MRGMHGTLDAELEVRRTIKRAELSVFLCLQAIVLTVVDVDNKEIIDGLSRGEMKCIGQKAKDAEFVDLDLGRIAQSPPRRHTGGSRARQTASLHKGNSATVALRKVHHRRQ